MSYSRAAFAWLAVVACAVLLCGVAARADEKSSVTSLFDGKTLEGWKKTVFGGEGDVVVRDGCIVLETGNPLTGITWTGKYPKMDYEISLEAKRVNGADFFCALTFPVGEDPCTFVVGGWGGGVVGLSSLDGFDASENETMQYLEFKNDHWYKVRVRVTGGKIEAWLDDKHMVDVETKGRQIGIRPEVELSRPLGISSYMTTAALRDIKIRRLDGKAK